MATTPPTSCACLCAEDVLHAHRRPLQAGNRAGGMPRARLKPPEGSEKGVRSHIPVRSMHSGFDHLNQYAALPSGPELQVGTLRDPKGLGELARYPKNQRVAGIADLCPLTKSPDPELHGLALDLLARALGEERLPALLTDVGLESPEVMAEVLEANFPGSQLAITDWTFQGSHGIHPRYAVRIHQWQGFSL